MTHSLIGAGRNTHFKMIVVSALAAIAIVCAGVSGRTSGTKDKAGQANEHEAQEAGSRQ
jgi:hypothetical protein